jgi:acetoacetyl-CoA synthetase
VQEPLWTPDPAQVSNSEIMRFAAELSSAAGVPIIDYDALHNFSIRDPRRFWSQLWDFCGVVGEKGGEVVVDGERMPGARFFPEARLNFAENLLRETGTAPAILFRGEDKVARTMSWDDLRAEVSRLQQALRARGVGKGDRVAAMMANMPETITAMLATASLGAIWSSCSPDFGEQGVLDRFGQIEPKVFLACDGYYYNGKTIDITGKLSGIADRLGAATNIIAPYLGNGEATAEAVAGGVTLHRLLEPFQPAELACERVPFNHPLYILYSSGTTGAPKCIVHSQGGTLLQHLKEHRLHCNLGRGDRMFYFTTCGWMMWNWLASGLASGCTLALYDGSPFHPDGNALFDYADEVGTSFFGASAKFFDSVRKAGLRPATTHDLSRLRMVASTGSPLAPENFEYIYEAIAPNVHLASMSGGTDIVACFVIGIPTKPVYSGEIQGPALGMAVDVWAEDGTPLAQGKGELVCTQPFPSMPVRFWNDPGDRKYRAAYFERFPGVWHHGDFAEWTQRGGMIIHGRSDATLNPGGVRIGTAEIYNEVEKLDEVLEALCIGQNWEGDVRVVLFVRLAKGVTLDEALIDSIKRKIRYGVSPRHVPSKVIAVADIPRTKSGKITELPVRDIIHGRDVGNREALANPEALDLYRDLAELTS